MVRKDDSRIIKEALQAKDIDELKKSMGDLKTQITEGFKGIHDRQDTTNGKVLKNTDDIKDETTNRKLAEQSFDGRFKYNRIIWWLCTILMSAVAVLASYIFFHKTGL